MSRRRAILVRLLGVVLILAMGFAAMIGLAKLRTEPEQHAETQVAINVTGRRVFPEDIQTELTGFGTVRAHRRTRISSEVQGRVLELHPALVEGGLVGADEVLVRIDPADYELRARQTEGEVTALEAQIEQLHRQQANDQERLKVVQRNLDLAQREFERFRQLVEEAGVESRSRLDQAEREVARQREQLLLLENELTVRPIQIRRQQARLAALHAQLEEARRNLSKTMIVAPFAGRIENKQVEQGQTVQPGTELLTLVDEQIMELTVPLQGGDVARWLDLGAQEAGDNWFTRLPPTPVTIRWTELPDRFQWLGRIDRVADYDEQTRTLSLVVRVTDPLSIESTEDAVEFPLAEGMFCQVSIPGRTLSGVYRLPQSALQPDGHVLVVEDGRMFSRAVQVERAQGNEIIISAGLSPGETVLTQRPARVLNGLPVRVYDTGSEPPMAEQPPAGPELTEAGEHRTPPVDVPAIDGKPVVTP